MKRIMLAAALFLAAGVATAAAEDAVQDADSRAVPVNFADLDLDRSADAASLLSRLRYATMRACDVDELSRLSPSTRRAVEACRNEALAEAVAKIDNPELTRIYASERR